GRGGSAAFFCPAVAPTQGDAEASFSLSWESRRFPNFLVSLVEGLAAAALPRALYECCRVAAVSVLGEERRGALAFGGRDGFAREVSHRMSLLQVQRDREKRQRRERVAKDSTEFSEEDLQMLAYELLLLCAHLHSQYAAFAALVAEADAEGVREGSEESPNEAQKKTETQSASARHSGEAIAEKASRERECEAEVDALLDKTGAAAPSRRRRTLLARRLSAKRQERRAPERPEEEMTGKEAEDASKSEKSRRGTTRKSGGLLFFSRGASGLLTRPTAPGTEREAQAMAAERVGGNCSRDEATFGEKAGGFSPSPRSPRRLAQEDQRKGEDPASDGLAPFGVSVEAWLRRTGVVPEARDASAASWREEGLSRGKRTATLSRWIAPDPPLLHANVKLLRQLLVLSRIAFQIPSSSSNILLRLLVPAADCLWAAGSRNCLHPCDLRFRVARLTEAWQCSAMFLSDVEREAAASGSGAAAKSRLRAPSRFFRRSRSSRALSVAGHLGLSGDSEGEGVSVSGGRETRDVARADDGRPPLPQVRLARSQSRRLGSRRRKQTSEDRGEVDPTREENSHVLGLPREQLLAAFWAMDVPLLLSLLLLLSKCCLDSRNASGLHVDAPVLAQGLVLVSQAAQLGVDPTAVSTREETWRHRRRETGAAETKGGASGPLPAELSRCFNLRKAARAGAGLLPLSLQSPALLLAACVWRNAATASSLANVDLFYEETGDRRRRADGAEATAESLEAFHASASPCMQDLNLHASPCPSRLSSHTSTVSPGAALEPQPGAAGQAGSGAAVEPQGERGTVSAEGVSVQKKTDSPALGRVGSLGLPESRQAELLGELRVGASVGPDGKALAPTGAASDEAFAPIGPEVVEAVAEILCAFPTFLKKPFAESAEAEPPALVLAAAAAGIRSGATTPVPSPALDLNASERPEADAEGAG
ncbi:hypothetical protein TGPRC2_242780B, partial [Toxoplasma gondii TgCatPRC2]